MPSTLDGGHEMCPECGEQLFVTCTKNQGNKKYRRLECRRCGKMVSLIYEGLGKSTLEKSKAREAKVKEMEKWIATNQPVDRAQIKAQFNLKDSTFDNFMFTLTHQCPLWESDKYPIQYGIDYSLRGTIEYYIGGHRKHMHNYGHTSSLEEL